VVDFNRNGYINSKGDFDIAEGFARRVDSMRASEIRALFAVANRPEIISLAGGMPYLGKLPFDEISKIMETLVREHGPKLWQYGVAQGDEELRETITKIVELEGLDATAQETVITAGSQQGLDSITRLFCDAGDVILAEAPNYVGALGVFRSYQVEVVNVELDEEGIILAKLEKTIINTRARGKRIKFLYSVPNFQNPSGITLAVDRRKPLVELCKKYGIMILEDNPYGLLSFDGQLYPTLRQHWKEGVIYLGSFSKFIAPGFRIGWIISPDSVRDKLVLSNESVLLCPSNASSLTIEAYLKHFDWKTQLSAYREGYKDRCNQMIETIDELLPNCKYNKPKGGFFLWLEMPEGSGVNSKDFLEAAVEAGVAYVPGTGFYDNGDGENFMRLSFCYPSVEEIEQGITRLANALKKTYPEVKF
jgi:DNA-binding transcriptional MocR family regulator